MRQRLALLVSVLALSPVSVSAQPPRPPLSPGNTVLIASYECAPDQLARADALMNSAVAPVLNKHVAAGRILNWGFLGTVIGTPANRHIYLWAADPVALMQARQVYLPEIQALPAFPEFSKICGAANVTLSNLIALSAAPPAK